MNERPKCLFCLREQAVAADYDLNAELDDDRAAACGLDDLCWEEQCDGCIEHAGRPKACPLPASGPNFTGGHQPLPRASRHQAQRRAGKSCLESRLPRYRGLQMTRGDIGFIISIAVIVVAFGYCIWTIGREFK